MADAAAADGGVAFNAPGADEGDTGDAQCVGGETGGGSAVAGLEGGVMMRLVQLWVLGILLVSGAAAIGYGAGPKPEPVVLADETLCRARLANWLMRYEDLAKPERERYESYRLAMAGCVR